MQQLIDLWGGMDIRRRALFAGGAAGVLTILVLLARLAGAPSYALLYSGLDPAAAGEIVSALETRGVAYEVRGDSIHVPENDRDALRMSLAGDGLPALGAAGYELLDSLSGFGTTSQMFDAAYWRAKEGELARTIAASPRIRAARVHLATPSSDPFARDREASASVSVRPASGGIASSHAQALRHLVASAVPGLLPESVTIIDSDSGRVLSGDDGPSATGDAAGLAETMRRNVQRLLNARVGPGNAVVEVNVDLETASQTVFERIIDPDSRVVIGTESQERENTSRDARDGAVTVASNLPEGDAAEGGESSVQTSEARETISYDVSETQRETETGPGQVRRITVAVLVNAVSVVGDDGVVTQEPREAAELETLSDLVRSAVGFDEARGDVVTLQSMPFEPQPEATDLADTGGGLLARLDPMRLLQLAALVGVALAVAFGVVRPAMRVADTNDTPAPALALAGGGASADGPTPMMQAAPPAELGPPDTDAAPAPEGASPMDAPDAPQAAGLPSPMDSSPARPPDPVDRLRRLIEEREEETVEILRSWMEEDEELT
ncbi:flagellar basal-body MS-ring/collar protein FliF [Nioella halotolerans]|uniref:flagellar basal-body MS-ring/collar protein FliF n=1 Tax=Nioella halotolerans TaxID=2303578 RepID=UPI003F660A4F